MDGCRFYMCRLFTGGMFHCELFETWDDVRDWMADEKNVRGAVGAELHSICNSGYLRAFDKAVLAWRLSGGCSMH